MFWDDGELDDLHFQIEERQKADAKRRREAETQEFWDHVLSDRPKPPAEGAFNPTWVQKHSALTRLSHEVAKKKLSLRREQGISEEQRKRRAKEIDDWYQEELAKIENS